MFTEDPNPAPDPSPNPVQEPGQDDDPYLTEIFELAETMVRESLTRQQMPQPSHARLDDVAGFGENAVVYMFAMFGMWMEAYCNFMRYAHPEVDHTPDRPFFDETAERLWTLGSQYLLPPHAGGNERAIEIVRMLLNDHVVTNLMQAPLHPDDEVFQVFRTEVFDGDPEFRDTCVLQVMLMIRGCLVEASTTGRADPGLARYRDESTP